MLILRDCGLDVGPLFWQFNSSGKYKLSGDWTFIVNFWKLLFDFNTCILYNNIVNFNWIFYSIEIQLITVTVYVVKMMGQKNLKQDGVINVTDRTV